MQARNTIVKTLNIVPEALKSVWNGVIEDETKQSVLLKVITAYGIMLATPAPPLVAACIAAFGLKRFGQGAYYLGSSLYRLFPALMTGHNNNEDINDDSVKYDINKSS